MSNLVSSPNTKVNKNNLIIGNKYIEKRGRTKTNLVLVSFCIIDSKKYCIFYNLDENKLQYPLEINEWISNILTTFTRNTYNSPPIPNEKIFDHEFIKNALTRSSYKSNFQNLSNIQFFTNFRNLNNFEIEIENEISPVNREKINSYKKNIIRRYQLTKNQQNNSRKTKVTYGNKKETFLIPSRSNNNYINSTNSSNNDLTANQIKSLHKNK
jgi:hypothetical protein